MEKYVIYLLSTFLIIGCTGKKGGAEIAGILPSPDSGSSPNIPDNSSPVIIPDAAAPVVIATPPPLAQEFMKPEAAQAKVEEIVQTMNADPQYQINNDDFSFLKSEGLVDDSNELKGWVK